MSVPLFMMIQNVNKCLISQSTPLALFRLEREGDGGRGGGVELKEPAANKSISVVAILPKLH